MPRRYYYRLPGPEDNQVKPRLGFHMAMDFAIHLSREHGMFCFCFCAVLCMLGKYSSAMTYAQAQNGDMVVSERVHLIVLSGKNRSWIH